MSTQHSRIVIIACCSLACAGGGRSGFLMTPELKPLRSCPYAPAGSDARLSLLVLSNHGDTIRSAHIRLTGKSASGIIQPTMEQRVPLSSGEYEFGPFPVGEYLLTVSDSGWQTAHTQLTYCGDAHFRLKAVLVPVAPPKHP